MGVSKIKSMKHEATGKLVYSIALDAWVFQLIIPCNDHDGRLFSGHDDEHEFYRKKALKLSKFCLEEKEHP